MPVGETTNDDAAVPERRMSGEDRAAQLLNVTMVTGIGVVAFGFVAWSLATEFASVREIYRSLAPEDQRHVTRLFSALVMLVLGLSLAGPIVSNRLKRRRARTQRPETDTR